MLTGSVSRSSSQPASTTVRVPRYLRRYTICAATQHRPTSPLANSFTPDDQWDRRRSESFTVNPGPKVHQYTYTTIPSPSPSSLFAPVLSPTTALSRAQSLVADPQQPLRRQSSNSSIHSQSSLSPSITECSFHTAFEYNRDQSNNLRSLSSNDPPISSSWHDHPLSIKNDWSDSSNSGFRSSTLASRGAQSSDDTVVSPPSDGKTEGKKHEEDDDEEDEHWPVTFLTTITRQDLDRYDKENEKQHKRSFTWGRKESRWFTDKESEDAVLGHKKSRRLKKKRPEPLQTEEEEKEATHLPAQPFEPRILSIYTDGEHEEFDPLKDLPTTREEPVPDDLPLQPDEITNEAHIGIPISSDDTILIGQDDEWEDMESSEHHHHHHIYRYRQEGMPLEDERDTWLDDSIPERIRSRTPQEILQGLDVVHEEEEEDSTSDAPGPYHLEKRGSYPHIMNKGKERQDDNDIHEETIEELDLLYDTVVVADPEKPEAPSEDPPPQQPTTEDQTQTPSSPRRKKLSKRRRSRRKLDTDSPPPPLPERNPKQKTKTKSKSDMRHRTTPFSSSKKPSIPTLRPRRSTTTTTTPKKTVMSSVRFHVFRPLTSFALLLGIDVGGGGGGGGANSRKRLSRELRTPNALLLGRHFSGKHIPRFPSRLDGKWTVDKKIAKYE